MTCLRLSLRSRVLFLGNLNQKGGKSTLTSFQRIFLPFPGTTDALATFGRVGGKADWFKSFFKLSLYVWRVTSKRGKLIVKIIQRSIILTYDVVGKLLDNPMKLRAGEHVNDKSRNELLTKLPIRGGR